jgi:hypothetical protein
VEISRENIRGVTEKLLSARCEFKETIRIMAQDDDIELDVIIHDRRKR